MPEPKMVVTAVLEDPQASVGHRYGVNALATRHSGEGHTNLFSAGRDGTVRCWDVSAEGVASVGCMDDHADWVNDVVCVHDEILASCSSDCTIKLWSTRADSRPVECETLRQHTDYVKALAYCREPQLLASAGCDCDVLLWDVAARTLASSSGEGHSDSIYCLAASTSGSLVVSGSVDTDVRVWDPRSPESGLRLAGHADVVRAVLLLPDGKRVVSCGSDRTLRLWHVGEQRCEAVWTDHSDSVYSLQTDPTGTHILSGDRSGSVRLTSIHDGSSHELLHAGAAVQKLLWEDSEEGGASQLWVATTQSDLTCWRLPSNLSAARQSPLAEHVHTIPGAAGIRRFEVLPTRLAVLTEDTSGEALLWDVCTGRVRHRYAKAAGDAKGPYNKLVRELRKERVAVPHWFSVSTRSGGLEVSLDADLCFNAEVYLSDLGLEDRDLRVNLGERLLATLFNSWREAQNPPPAKDTLPLLSYRPLSEVPIRVSQQGVVILKCTAEELSQVSAKCIPPWVSQCVLKGIFSPRESSKLSFFLSPHASDDLPTLPYGLNKLSASKFLKVHKVAAYVVSKLPHDEEETPPELQLMCNDQQLPGEMSLATVFSFLWKTPGEDMQLQYRRVPHETEA
ncbi:hypothetical protein AB1Y20_020428 [Prymnesium parvum]|uniref:WD repeat-containing protein 48 homolog n=1 Tax=Prymnesium parvum TaxID=97485 RepID=A0AB34JV26_PRYPA|mmetsp:Transcript_559/g.1520  ORF Transcript_559/g.1520 Transcript_559/m.1520 type:complete len:622 (+) Transcript_559:268-2133(+)